MDILGYYSLFNDSSSFTKNVWNVLPERRHAMMIYSDFLPVSQTSEYIDEYGGELILPSGQSNELTINNFSFSDVILRNAKLITDEYNSEKITLDIPERMVSLIIDNSGSMSWNDQSGNRFEIAKRLINRLSNVYNITEPIFNIVSFGGKKVHFLVSAHTVLSEAYAQETPSDLFANLSKNVYGVRLVRKQGSYPQNPSDGTIVFDGIANKVFDSNLVISGNYYYTIFTYDNNKHFSSGKQFKIPVRTSNTVPDGINIFYDEIQQGRGIKVDNNIEAVWHFLEGDGEKLYDFSTNVDLDIVNPRWVGSAELSFGKNALRLDGSGYSYASKLTGKLSLTSVKTFMAWITPYDYNSNQVILARQSSTATNYILSLNTSGGLDFSIDGTSFVSSLSGVVFLNEPNFIAVTVDLSSKVVNFYSNGYFAGTATLPSSSTTSTSMNFDIGYDRRSVFDGLHGEITEVSIHSIKRDTSYIANYSSATNVDYSDNGDRLTILHYYVPTSPNYSNSLIIGNEERIPSNESDGDIISSVTVGTGYNYATYRKDFKLNSNYYFRIFSKNSSGNYSDVLNSPSLAILIPDISDEVKNSLAIISQSGYPNITVENVIEQNNSIYFNWDQITLVNYPEASRIRIYSSTDTYPVGDINGFTGTLLFDKGLSETYYIDRDLINNIYYYYTIAVIDKYGRVLKTSSFAASPINVEESLLVPLYDIEEVSYRLVAENEYEIRWEDLFGNKNLKGFMNEDIVFDMAFMDDLGNIISEDVSITGTVTGSFDFYPDTELDSVTQAVVETGTSPSFSDLYVFTLQEPVNGTCKAIIQTTKSKSLIKNIKDINFNVVFKAVIKNPNTSLNVYEYSSSPITVKLFNPVTVDVNNLNDKKVDVICKSYLNNEVISTKKEYDGVYVGAYSPLKLRIYINYLNSALDLYSYSYSVYQATKDLCSVTDPVRGSDKDTSIVPVVTQSVIGTQEAILDSKGNPTGQYKDVSYVDFDFYPTSSAQNILFYFMTGFGSYTVCKKFFIVFSSTLRIELGANIPRADAIQKTEQSASAYLVDPDYPDDISKRVVVTDGTLISWELNSIDSSTQRYLIGGSGICNGVCSPIESGVAKNVFIAPVNNPKARVDNNGDIVTDSDGNILFEQYSLSAKLVYNDVVAQDSLIFSFLPITSGTQGVSGSYFLMEFDNYKQDIWADGESYAKIRIVHNPNVTITKNSPCFVNCLTSQGKEIVTLQEGQSIYINTNNKYVEIISGDVIEDPDPYTGRQYLNTSSAIIGESGSSYITLGSGDSTYVYFRIKPNSDNTLYNDQQSEGFETFTNNLCSCLNGMPLEKYKYQITVSGYCVTVNNGSIIGLVGGGNVSNGIPTTQLIPQEPLEIKVIDKLVNGISVDNIKIDGVSENEILLQVSYSGFPIPDGTPIALEVINTYEDVVNIKDSTVYTYTIGENSYALVTILSLPENKTFEANIYATASYNPLIGGINRVKTVSLYLSHDAEDTENGENQGIFSLSSEKTSLSSDPVLSWSEIAQLNVSRGHLNTVVCNGSLYAIGGVNGTDILGIIEVYDHLLNTWTQKTSMTTPRMMSMSISNGNYIYVIGGIVFNETLNILEVSQKVERYNTISDTWSTMADMPTVDIGSPELIRYGIAAGTAQLYGNKIYVMSGMKTISEDGLSFDYNDRVLIYDILTNSWTYSDTVSGVFYSRIFPLSILDSTDIVVFSGSYSSPDSVELIAKTYSYNIISGVLENSDYKFSVIPELKYKSAITSSGNRNYIIGGQDNSLSNLRTCEVIDISTTPYTYEKATSIINGKNGSGAAIISISGNNSLINVGGMQSGKALNFLKIDIETYNNMTLNGIDGVGVIVKLQDEDGDIPTHDVTLSLKGYIQSKDIDDSYIATIQDSLVKNIVKFNEDQITVSNGIGYFLIQPRSDDVISGLDSSISFSENVTALRYKIVLQATVEDNTYYGKLFINTEKTVSNRILNTSVKTINLSDNVKIDSSINYNNFKLISGPLKQSKVNYISCYSSDPWIGDISSYINLTGTEAKTEIDYMSLESPIGVSPLYDALLQNAKDINSNDYYGKNKIIYAFTDSEPNSSFSTIEDAIVETNGINENKTVPIILGNFCINSPSLSPVFSNESESDMINKLCEETNGQAIDIISSTFNDDVIYSFIAANSSIGNGQAEFIIDLTENADIVNILTSFDLYENSDATYKIFTSEDGNSYTEYSKVFDPNILFSFSGLTCRYIKFQIKLLSGLSKDNLEANDNVPANGYLELTSITISYRPERIDYAYMNEIEVSNSVKQIVINVDSNIHNEDESSIDVGVSTSNTHNWIDFANPAQPARINGGKIVIPTRSGLVNSIRVEPLISLDGYAFKATYGNWSLESDVIITDITTSLVISSSEYKALPREGLVIFNSKRLNNYVINITNKNKIKIGLKITNNKEDDFIRISNISDMKTF